MNPIKDAIKREGSGKIKKKYKIYKLNHRILLFNGYNREEH